MEMKNHYWIAIMLVASGVLSTFLAVLFLLESFWGTLNYTMASIFGTTADFIIFFLLAMFGALFYEVVLLCFYLRQRLLDEEIRPHVAHKIISVIVLVLFSALQVYLLIQFKREVWQIPKKLGTAIFVFFLVLNLGVMLLLYVHLRPLLSSKDVINSTMKTRKWQYTSLALMAGLALSIVLPFAVVPANALDGDLPTKPLLIAHRGASFIGPENTIKAGEIALEYEIVGWEIDVQISWDGQPFLMHDNTAKRTTDVEDVFPDRCDDNASSFTMPELRQLDAGSWWVDEDFHRSIKKGWVSNEQAETYRNASIATLEEALDFTRDNGILVDIDWKEPSTDHPFHDQLFNLTLEALLDSGVPHSDILIYTDNTDWLDRIEAEAPGMITSWSILDREPPSAEEVIEAGYDGISDHLSLSDDQVKAYIEAGIHVNIWTLNSKVLFSRFWALGATYIVTDIPNVLEEMDSPSWTMQRSHYFLAWAVFFVMEVISLVTSYGIKVRKLLLVSRNG